MIPLHDDTPTSTTPVLTVATIVTCALVFLWQVSLSDEGQEAAVYALGVIPATLLGGKHLPPELALVPPSMTLLTSMFLHGGWMHLIGNMLYLWIFGNNVEDALGHTRFAIFYLLCGVVAALAQALPDPESTLPMVGASGAISGVLGAYLLLYPHARVLVLVPIGLVMPALELPAVLVLGFWFVLQLLSYGLSDSADGGVAFGAHVGGFVAGMLLVLVMRRRGVRLLAPPQPGRRLRR